jgi:hypothetical protein
MCPKTHLGHKAFLGLPQLGEQGALLHVHLGDLGTEDSHTFLYVNFFHPKNRSSDFGHATEKTLYRNITGKNHPLGPYQVTFYSSKSQQDFI